MSEMTEERMADLRMRRARAEAGRKGGLANAERLRALAERRESIADDHERAKVAASLIAGLAADNDRLRADNDRLTAAHRFLLASSYCREEMDCLAAGPLDLGGHDRFCAVRIAYDALNPEQTS